MKENPQGFTIRVPASTANLGPGFDSFGLALPFYLTIHIELADKDSIILVGEHLSSLPRNENNLIYKTIKQLFQIVDEPLPSLALQITSEIPLARGLGSSGAAIVGGLLAANQLITAPKTLDELFQIAVKLEGHADNVGASLFGGFVVTAYDGETAKVERLALPLYLNIMLAIPNYPLATSQARGQIPAEIPLKDVAFNIGHSALMVTYLLTGQLDKVNLAMKDRVHQPYRQDSVKGLKQLIEIGEKTGDFCTALSGAGPTILLLVKDKQIAVAENAVSEVAEAEGIEMTIKIVSAALKGAELIKSPI